MNVAILNGWFVLGYVGALLFTAAAVALHLPAEGHDALPATIAALVLYVGNIGVTSRGRSTSVADSIVRSQQSRHFCLEGP